MLEKEADPEVPPVTGKHRSETVGTGGRTVTREEVTSLED